MMRRRSRSWIGYRGTTFHHVVDSPTLSGLRRRGSVFEAPRIEEIEVRVETLDRAIPQMVPISFVKIDVEGGELAVIRGGIEILRKHKPLVVFACGLGGADHLGTQPGDLFDAFNREAKLKVSLLGSWLARRSSLSRQDFIDQFQMGLKFYFVAHP